MTVRTALLVNTMLVILLPLATALAAWSGLTRMDAAILHMQEEYEEARLIADAEVDLQAAIAAMRSGETVDSTLVRPRLERVEATLLGYLAEQAISEASAAAHQEVETGGARDAIERLRSTLDRTAPASVGIQRLLEIEEPVARLRAVADRTVLETQASADRIRDAALRQVVAVGLATAVICSVLMTVSNRGIFRRLHELHRSIGDRGEDPRPSRGTDLQQVVDDIDAFHDRLRRELEEKNRELLRKERVAGIGLLAADVAHELRNPLNAMLGLTELSLRSIARDGLDDPRAAELHDSLSVVRREAVRCREIVDRLMAMVRDPGRPGRFDASSLLAETIEVARAARPDRAACFVLRTAGTVEATAPVPAVRQVMLTLLINAADAIGEDGRIEVDATATGEEVWLRVRDDGCGFDPGRPPDRSVPFETTRSEEGGTGLGLSIAQSVAASIGGEIRASSDGPGRGSLFMLALPVVTGGVSE